MNQLTRALVAAVLTLITAAAIASPAQAGWMTGTGAPPVWTTESPCHNGMVWTYGNFQSGAWPPTLATMTIHDLALVKTGMWDPIQDPPAPGTALFNSDQTVPQKLLVLPSWFMLIPPTFYPEDSPGHHRVNHFDFSRKFAFKFKAFQPTGTGLRMFWRSNPDQAYFLRTGTYYTVADCWTATIAHSRVAGTVAMTIAGADDMSTKAFMPRLRLEVGGASVPASQMYAEDSDHDGDKELVLVFATDARLKCRVGDPVVVTGTTGVLQTSGC